MIFLLMLPLAAAAQSGNYYYVKQFAEEGIPAAQYICGVYLENGIQGVGKDVERALLFYSEEAKQGHLEALEALARCYRNGVGVEKDIDKMNYYLKKYDEVNAAMGGFKPEHCINTEDEFEDGRLEDYSTDCDYAFEAEEAGKYAKMEYYATRAAVRGDIFAQFNLGLWYERAAQLGDVDCLLRLEDIYRKGRPGVPRNLERADYWRKEYEKFQKAKNALRFF